MVLNHSLLEWRRIAEAILKKALKDLEGLGSQPSAAAPGLYFPYDWLQTMLGCTEDDSHGSRHQRWDRHGEKLAGSTGNILAFRHIITIYYYHIITIYYHLYF